MIKNNIRRESYLKFLNTWKNRDLIKVLSGVRRSGKSTLLAMFQQDLKEQGVQDENIIAINFEYMEFEELTIPTLPKFGGKWLMNDLPQNVPPLKYLKEVLLVFGFPPCPDLQRRFVH